MSTFLTCVLMMVASSCACLLHELV